MLNAAFLLAGNRVLGYVGTALMPVFLLFSLFLCFSAAIYLPKTDSLIRLSFAKRIKITLYCCFYRVVTNTVSY